MADESDPIQTAGPGDAPHQDDVDTPVLANVNITAPGIALIRLQVDAWRLGGFETVRKLSD